MLNQDRLQRELKAIDRFDATFSLVEEPTLEEMIGLLVRQQRRQQLLALLSYPRHGCRGCRTFLRRRTQRN
jgi:hypothetical protein